MQNQPGGPPPVFVDRTGRRRRLTVIAGSVMGVGLLTSLVLILAGLFFDSSVPLPGWSETKVQPPIEAGVNAPGTPGNGTSPSPRSEPATSTSAPAPGLSPTSPATAGATRGTAPTAQPTTSGPGQGDERRTAKPSKTPGKP